MQARIQGGGRSPLAPPGISRAGLPPPMETMFKNQHLAMTKTKGLSKFPVSANFFLKPENLQLFKNRLQAIGGEKEFGQRDSSKTIYGLWANVDVVDELQNADV